MEREQSPFSVNNVHKPFEGEGVKQQEMLLLRIGEVEEQISANSVEIKENQGLLGHSRGEEPRLALGRGICTEARQAEL